MERPRIWTGTADKYVSVIGVALVTPLLHLLEDLHEIESGPPNEVQVSNPENGLAVGVVTAAAIMMESALNRTRYVRRDHPRGKPSADYFKSAVSDDALAADLEEVVVLRDVIVHNHVWEAFVGPGPDGRLKFWATPTLPSGYGDKKFQKVLDPELRVTRRLGLNLFPPRIDHRDAHIVVKTVAKSLRALESKSREYFPIQDNHFEFGGKDLTFYEIADSLPT
jgi:hypothetical protein